MAWLLAEPLTWPQAPWDGLDALLLAQVALSVASAPLFFRLQARADAITLSQIGYVAVIAGTAAGALLYGESPSAWMVPSLFLLFAGMRLVGRGRAPEPTAPRGESHA